MAPVPTFLAARCQAPCRVLVPTKAPRSVVNNSSDSWVPNLSTCSLMAAMTTSPTGIVWVYDSVLGGPQTGLPARLDRASCRLGHRHLALGKRNKSGSRSGQLG